MSTMYSKVKVAGHPIHPMLVAFPITFYTTAFIAFVAYAVTSEPEWWQVGLRANLAGVITAAVAAIPGIIDWMKGIPEGSPAKVTGRNHMLLTVATSTLFAVNLLMHRHAWDVIASSASETAQLPDPVGALVLSGIGLVTLLGAGFLGFRLVHTHHVGVDLSAEQARLDSHG